MPEEALVIFLVGLIIYLEIWRKSSFAQVAADTQSFHLGKLLNSGFLSWGAPFSLFF